MAIIFTAAAVAQHWFVHQQLLRSTKRELTSWASEIKREIAYNNGWDLTGFRQSSITVPSWFVFSREGLIIDSEDYLPGLIPKVEPPVGFVFGREQTLSTAANETWRLLGEQLEGGYVIVGTTEPGVDLQRNLKKFGSSFGTALKIKTRDIDSAVDYAVVTGNGEIKSDWGGVPLKIDPARLPDASSEVIQFLSDSGPYLLYVDAIRNENGKEVGKIIIPKNVAVGLEAVHAQDRFNYFVVAGAALAVFILVVSMVANKILRQPPTVTIEEALRVGETATIEFKSTFQWDVNQNRQNDDRRLDTLKSIAGFLNTKGGTLFIGVTEETNPPTIRGFDEDLRLAKGSKDHLRRLLRDLITARIGSEFSPLISDSIEEMNGKLFWMIVIEESPEPAFVRWKDQKRFYVREGPKTSDLDSESAWRYIKNHWR